MSKYLKKLTKKRKTDVSIEEPPRPSTSTRPSTSSRPSTSNPSSTQTRPPTSLPKKKNFTDKQKAFYQNLKDERTLKQTRHYFQPDMLKLGIDNDVRSLTG